MPMSDEIVEQTREVREELIARHGGIDGYFKHCQAQDRASAGWESAPWSASDRQPVR